MQVANFDGVEAISARERLTAVEALYLQHYFEIKELVSSDPTLSLEISDKIASGFVKRLYLYRGPLTAESFLQWVADTILPAVSFTSIYEQCRPSVREAIRKVFATCLDLGITRDQYDDAEQGTWLWVCRHLRELRDPGKSRASTKTRLYSVARFQALTIRKSLLRAKERQADVALSRIGADAYGLVIEPLAGAQLDPYTRSETAGATVPKNSRP